MLLLFLELLLVLIGAGGGGGGGYGILKLTYAWPNGLWQSTGPDLSTVNCMDDLWISFLSNVGGVNPIPNVTMIPFPSDPIGGAAAFNEVIANNATKEDLWCNFRKRCEMLSDPSIFRSNLDNLPGITIPTTIGLLTDLRVISLGCVPLAGSIPTEIGLLTKLEVLEISSTNLEGNLPWLQLAKLTNLKRFIITERCSKEYKFQGCCTNSLSQQYYDQENIPCQLESLDQCCASRQRVESALDVSRTIEANTLTIAPWLIEESLIHPFQNNNSFQPLCSRNPRIEEPFDSRRFRSPTRRYFSGPLDPLVKNLTSLKHLELFDVFLSGVIPPELGLLSNSLTHLSLRFLNTWDSATYSIIQEGMTGIIPTELGELTNLNTLRIEGEPLVPYHLQRQSNSDLVGDPSQKIFESLIFTNLSRSARSGTTTIHNRFSSWGLLNFRTPVQSTPPFMCATQLLPFDDVFVRVGGLQSLEAVALNNPLNLNREPGTPFDLEFYRNPFGATKGLSGILPTQLGRLSSLKSLSIAHHQLSGAIPQEMLNGLTSLETLKILNTHLSGSMNLTARTAQRSFAYDEATLGNLDSSMFENTIAYNRFTGCTNNIDALAGRLEFKLVGDSIVTNLSIPTPRSNFGNLPRIEVDSQTVPSNVDIRSGIPQQCFNTLQTLVNYCNNTGQIAPQEPICITQTNTRDLAALNKIKAALGFANGPENINIVGGGGEQQQCTGIFRQHVYYMSTLSRFDPWPEEFDPCFDSWPGVYCDSRGNVIGLHLSGRFGWSLVGDLPNEIGDLTFLKYVDLSFNSITSIPTTIGLLTNLRTLDLSFNNITNIPKELVTVSQKFFDRSDSQVTSNNGILPFATFSTMIKNGVINNFNAMSDAERFELLKNYFALAPNTLWLSSLEGNPLNKSQLDIVCAPNGVDCSKLGLGDGSCAALNLENFTVTALDLIPCSSKDIYGFEHLNQSQRAVPTIGDAWECDICAPDTNLLNSSLYLFVIGASVLFSLIFMLVFFAERFHPGLHIAIKVLISYFQMISIIIVPSINIPIEIQPFFLVFNIVSFSIPTTDLACVQGENGPLTSILNADPSVFLIVFLACYLGLLSISGCLIKCNRHCGPKASSIADIDNTSSSLNRSLSVKQISRHVKRRLCCCVSPERNDKINEDVWDGLLIKIPALIIIPVTSTLVLAYSTLVPQYQVPTEGVNYFDPKYFNLVASNNQAYGISLVLNTIILFAVIAYFIHLAWFLHHCDTGHIAPYRAQFLTADYLPAYYYWLGVDLSVRMAIAVITSTSLYATIQLGVSAVFLAIGFGLCWWHRPFRSKAVYQFQMASYLSQSLILFLVITWFSLQEQFAESEVILSIGAATISLAYICIAIALARFTRSFIKEILHDAAEKKKSHKTGASEAVVIQAKTSGEA